MIVYLFNQNYFTKLYLPLVIDGVYPILMENKKFLANIEEKNGKWSIQSNSNIEISCDGKVSIENELIEYKVYSIKDILFNVSFYVIATPRFNENNTAYITEKDELKIGAQTGDIVYSNINFNMQDIVLKYVENRWNFTTQDNNLFVMNERAKTGKIKCGDYIFYYGLKIIFIDKTIIINNPSTSLKVSDSFKIAEKIVDPKLPNPIGPDDTPLYDKDDYFTKAPRFMSIIEEEKVKIDEPPAPTPENDASVILTVGPQLTMMATSVVTLISYVNSFLDGTTTVGRFITSAVTISITIIGTLMWPALTRNFNKKNAIKKEEKRQSKYINYLQSKKHEIFLIKSKQRQTLIEQNVSLEDCKSIILSKAKTLWQRNIEHEDFLRVRLGQGSVPTKIDIDNPEERFSVEDKDKLLSLLNSLIDESKYIPKCPLSITLTEKYITAIVGKKDLTKRFMDTLFLQIMTFHAFTELKIVVFTNDYNKSKWNYLKILPHCWNNQKTTRYFATSLEEMNTLSIDLEKTFGDRVSGSEEAEKLDNGSKESEGSNNDIYKSYKPYYLIFTDDIVNVRAVPIIKKILEYKKNVGFSLLMLNDRLSTLPSQTTTFINVDEPLSGLVGTELLVDNQMQFEAELNTDIDVYSCAKNLANIPIQVEKAKYELPSSLSFLEMFNVGKVEQLNSLERWKNNNPVNSLAVPVGIDQNGELFKMDIHEKVYGPHGLVAGTTGSGKSEWIITYILSLAVNFHPDEVQFVLIDYKGGGLAMSFENSELGIKLPHLAGTVTNLDKSAINRVIASIESELKRRQKIFNEARETLKEGSMNIYKYQQFYRKKMVKEPMSHLLIISDEFAELKSQQPEFMEQLISTSRIGRSLGVHLILATQKPSGVVNDQIWSNSRFKVCLKVQDKSDSQEMLKKPDAAYLKQVGAFYLQVGNDEYYNLGQSAWAGAKYYPSDVLKKKIDQSVQYIDNIGGVVNSYDIDLNKRDVKDSKGEELLNVIQYIDNVSDKTEVIGRRLWLDNIPAVTYISDIKKKYNHIVQKNDFTTVIGEYDEPRKQEQGVLKINLADGNIGIIGQVGSGKENLISLIIWSSMTEHTPQEINYYILDFGAETLKKFSKFPHVGEVIFQDEMDKAAGVLELVTEEIDKRKAMFADYNGSFETYNKNSGKTVPLICFIINGFDVLEELIPKMTEFINTLFRDCSKYGVTFIVSVSSGTGLRQRQLQYFNRTIMLQLQDESMYRTVTNCRQGLMPSKLFGRGICKVNDDDDSYCEFQTSLIVPEDQQMQYLKSTAEKYMTYYKTKARQLAKIPDTVGSEELTKYLTNLENVPIGYNFYEKDIAKYNFLENKITLVASKSIAENIKFLYALSALLAKIPNTKVRVIDLIDIFKKPILDIKMFNENLDVVFSALDDDLSNRKENQDWGITIIVGVASYKKKLSKVGLIFAESMFNKIISSTKSLFILVDDYDKMKNLKLEPWYATINTTKAIWLGTGVNNQSMFSVDELKTEDKKFRFEGLAFKIIDGKYTIIKTVMDGDE